MALQDLFGIAKSTIFASQTALTVTSHNISNVNTPGFTRREAIFAVNPVSLSGNLLGSGVTVTGIKRYYDQFIQTQLLGQYQNYGKSSALNQTLSQIEQIFNEVKNIGLATPLMDFFNAWQDVATNPEGFVQRSVLLQKADSLVLAVKRMERGIEENLESINENIDNTAERINSIASEIATINGKITKVEAGSQAGSAHDLRDQRDVLMNELATLADFSFYEDENGSVTIMVGMGNLVSGETLSRISTRINEEGDKDIYLDGINITENISKGQLGGFISVRDTIRTSSLSGLRRLTASLIQEINILHRTGYGLDGTTENDFFAPLQLSVRDFSSGADMTASITDLSQLTLDEYSIQFDSASNYYIYNNQTGLLVTSGTYISGNPIDFDGIRVIITGTVTSDDEFSVSPLTDVIKNFEVAITNQQKIAAASSDTSLPGDNSNVLLIAQLFENTISNLSDTTFFDYYEGLVSTVGTMSRSASDSFTFDENLLSELNTKRESLSGVSLDEEAANLIRFQRSFEAGAKMIQVTDELFQTIIELL
ncbi:MAG: flagellar hook-associated protein FlgK [Thermodesulfovibrionales bacterium]